MTYLEGDVQLVCRSNFQLKN